MKREPVYRVSQLMANILVVVAARSVAGASVREIVALAAPEGQARSVARASVSRTLRRLWRRGAVELHDSRWAGAGRTMSGLQHRAHAIALEAEADPEAFYNGALKVRNYLRIPGDPPRQHPGSGRCGSLSPTRGEPYSRSGARRFTVPEELTAQWTVLHSTVICIPEQPTA